MTTLFVDRRGAELDAEAGRLVVRVAGERSATVPLRPLERVVLGPSAKVSTRLLAALWRNGTALLCLTGTKRLPEVRVPGRSTDDAKRRLAQYALLQDEPRRALLARSIVEAKLEAQAQVVANLVGATGPGRELSAAAERLQQARDRLAAAGPVTRASLRGIEGATANAYFAGLASVFPESLGFRGRNRRPPRDPVNACLSLGYTLLHTDAVREAAIAGLEPTMGVLHDLAPGRESLACDLAEPFRPRIDLWVWTLFRRQVLGAESFGTGRAGCRLGKAARRAFYAAYEADAPTWRDPLREATARLGRLIVEAEGGLAPRLLAPPTVAEGGPDDQAPDLAGRL